MEEAWRIVDPVLKAATPVYQYQPKTWGPREVDQKVSPVGGWHNPVVTGPTSGRSGILFERCEEDRHGQLQHRRNAF